MQPKKTLKEKHAARTEFVQIRKVAYLPVENEVRLAGAYPAATTGEMVPFVTDLDGNELFSTLYQAKLLHNTNWRGSPRWKLSDPCPQRSSLTSVVCDRLDDETATMDFAFTFWTKDGEQPEILTTEQMSVADLVDLLAGNGMLDEIAA